jgi:hypothetical protein
MFESWRLFLTRSRSHPREGFAAFTEWRAPLAMRRATERGRQRAVTRVKSVGLLGTAVLLATSTCVVVPAVAGAESRSPQPRHNGKSAPTFRITAGDQAQEFAQAVGTPNAVVQLAAGVSLDLSSLPWVNIAGGVQILGDYTHPPHVFTTYNPGAFLVVPSGQDNVRISGIALDGGHWEQAETEEEDSTGIQINSARNVQIDHNNISGWTGSGVEVLDDDNRIDLDHPEWMAHVSDNFIHHNQHQTGDVFGGGHGAGYGVVVSNGGYAQIENNAFDYNRHAIAGDGSPGDGYYVSHNLIMRQGGWNTDTYHTHIIDMHGTNSCTLGSYNCGPAGEYMKIEANTILYESGTGIKLRGTPSMTMDVVSNVFAHEEAESSGFFDPAAMGQTETGLHTNLNKLGFDYDANTTSQPVCDFNGDGVNDKFFASGTDWWYGGFTWGEWDWLQMNQWRHLQNAGALLRDVSEFGDFNGDGLCDVRTTDNVTHYTPASVR